MEFVQARPNLCEEEEEEEEDEINTSNIGSKAGSIISHHHHGHHHHHHQQLMMSQQRWRSSSTTTTTPPPPPPHHHHHQFYDKDQSSSSCDQPSLNISNSNNTTTTTTTTTTCATRAESSEGDGGGAVEREHMFDKVVTPSDVGKLNRLVIPKQHAEKYFPLDSSTNDNKGLLLNFEDRSGKAWRFRYSYWNSSQSYVMTKGWSRFVKEKKLYAGDIVSFERGAAESEKDRLYIDWRRRPDRLSMPLPPPPLPLPPPFPLGRLFLPSSLPMPSMAMRDQPYLYHRNFDYYDNNNNHHFQQQLLQQQQMSSTHGYANYNVVNHHHHHHDHQGLYLRSSSSTSQLQAAEEAAVVPMVFDSVPVVHGKAAAAAKRLRLFGVNVECPISEDEVLSSTTVVPLTHTTMPVSSLSHHHHLQIGSSIPQYHHPLQLRLYNNVGAPQAAATTVQPTHELPPNREAPMSLDLDI
ncbi:hypothetical protein Scep_025171 [Stephania cephalantha]|uniref:TF-B3 domain-containing protein n=1 Tax=Stephania cephalantha TaxID=152367 RepID=A0AAP0HR00_9MAGN